MSKTTTTSFFSSLMAGLTRRVTRQDKALSKSLEALLECSYGNLMNSADLMERVTKAMDLAAAQAAIRVLEEVDKENN